MFSLEPAVELSRSPLFLRGKEEVMVHEQTEFGLASCVGARRQGCGGLLDDGLDASAIDLLTESA